MSEDEAFLALQKWMEDQERVTFYRCLDTRDWYIEWFNDKAKYNYVYGPSLIKLIEEHCK